MPSKKQPPKKKQTKKKQPTATKIPRSVAKYEQYIPMPPSIGNPYQLNTPAPDINSQAPDINTQAPRWAPFGNPIIPLYVSELIERIPTYQTSPTTHHNSLANMTSISNYSHTKPVANVPADILKLFNSTKTDGHKYKCNKQIQTTSKNGKVESVSQTIYCKCLSGKCIHNTTDLNTLGGYQRIPKRTFRNTTSTKKKRY